MSARTEARGARAIDFRVRPSAGNFPNIDIFPKLGQERSANWGWYSALPASVTTRSLPLLLDEMKACNVVHGVVWGRADLLPGQSVPHEDVAAILAANPEVFVAGFGGITLQGGIRKAVAEVERAKKLGLKGVTVEPGWSGMPDKRADDASLYPIYEACQELDLILAMTSGARMGPDISYASPEACDRVARDFGRMQIVVSHAFWPWVEESCGLDFRRENVWLLPDLYGWSSAGHGKWIEAANTFLADRLLFGSAYPLMGTADIVDAYRRLPYAQGVLDKVLYRNAARLLGLDIQKD